MQSVEKSIVEHFTRYQLTVCSHGSSGLAELLVDITDRFEIGRQFENSSLSRVGFFEDGSDSGFFEILELSKAISHKRYKRDVWFLLKTNRKSHALYRIVTLPISLGDPQPPQTTPFSTFRNAFDISVKGEVRHFKLGGQVYRSMSQPIGNKPSLEVTWLGPRDHP